jgi:hypothetical protein
MSHDCPLDTAAALAAMRDVPATPLLVAVGQYSPDPRVAERVGVLAVDGHPKLLLDEWVVPSEIPRLTESLAARRGGWDVMAATDWERAWTADGAPFVLWDRKGRVAWQEGGGIRFRDGPSLAISSLRGVHAFVDADWRRRGVRLEPAAGQPLLLAQASEPLVELDPTYDAFNLICDASWAVELARSLAAAIGVPVKVDELLR